MGALRAARLLLLHTAAAYFRMEETDCYSCASQVCSDPGCGLGGTGSGRQEYEDVWDRDSRSHKPISSYLNRPRKFSTLCSNPDAFRTFAAVTKCNFTCLSILEPTVAGGSHPPLPPPSLPSMFGT